MTKGAKERMKLRGGENDRRRYGELVRRESRFTKVWACFDDYTVAHTATRCVLQWR